MVYLHDEARFEKFQFFYTSTRTLYICLTFSTNEKRRQTKNNFILQNKIDAYCVVYCSIDSRDVRVGIIFLWCCCCWFYFLHFVHTLFLSPFGLVCSQSLYSDVYFTIIQVEYQREWWLCRMSPRDIESSSSCSFVGGRVVFSFGSSHVKIYIHGFCSVLIYLNIDAFWNFNC